MTLIEQAREIALTLSGITSPDILERYRAGDFDDYASVKSALAALQSRDALIREAVEALEHTSLAMPVLITMLKAARLGKGANVARQIEVVTTETLAKLKDATDDR